MAAAAKDSLTVKWGLCEELLEGTAKYPHFTVPPSGDLVSARKTEHQTPWKFTERILRGKDSDNRTALRGPPGHNLHSQTLLWLKKLLVSDLTIRIASDEHLALLWQCHSPWQWQIHPNKEVEMKCHWPVEKVLGPYQKCQVHYPFIPFHVWVIQTFATRTHNWGAKKSPTHSSFLHIYPCIT